jgi:ATP phosphoribosyltransferase
LSGISAILQLGKRIATTFSNISTSYFQNLDPSSKTQIRFISGSVEAACSLGLADGIVDLVESGETMRAAGLRPIATIMDTQSVLICGKRERDQAKQDVIDVVYRRFMGLVTAGQYVLVNYNIEKSGYEKAKGITPGKKEPTVTMLGGPDGKWISVGAMVEKKKVVGIMDELEIGMLFDG